MQPAEASNYKTYVDLAKSFLAGRGGKLYDDHTQASSVYSALLQRFAPGKLHLPRYHVYHTSNRTRGPLQAYGIED